MESPCLVITNPAYGFATLPETTDTATSATRRAGTRERERIHLTANNAYSSLEYSYVTWTPNAAVGPRTARNAYEEVRNGSANLRTTANELISMRHNVLASYSASSQQSLLSELDSPNGLYSTLFEQRRASRKRRKRKYLACDATIVFAALASIVLSGVVIAACVAYEFRHISSSGNSSHVRNNTSLPDQCNCTLGSEFKWNSVSRLFIVICLANALRALNSHTIFSISSN